MLVGLLALVFAIANTVSAQSPGVLGEPYFGPMVYGSDGKIYGRTSGQVYGQITKFTTPSAMPLCEINRSLGLGMRGEEVRCLQRYLNWSGFTVSLSGPGSYGLETDYYGPLTMSAVMRWQSANATFVPSTGFSGDSNGWGFMSFNRYVNMVRAYHTL